VPRLDALHAWALSSLFVYCLYVVRVGGDFMHYRFMFQAYPTLAVAALVAVAQLLSATSRRRLVAALAAYALLLGLGSYGHVRFEQHYHMQSLPEMDGYTGLGRRVGETLERALPAGTVIATTLAGTVAYYSQLETIDQWGINDKFVAHQTVVGARPRGHVKAAPESYLRDRHVNFLFGHPVVCSCSHPPSRSAYPEILTRLEPMQSDQCVRSRYLTPTPGLTAYLCAHPEQFVLSNIACPPPPR
jgi:hypothetical protein